jgi:hypothetical protein
MRPNFMLHSGAWTKLLCVKWGDKRERERERKTLSGKKLYLCGILAGTTESETKLQKNIDLRNLKS